MAKFRYKYLFFDPVNLLKEIKADASGAADEYNRVRDVVRSRVRALDRAGFDYGDLGAELYKAPRASGLSDVQMAQGLSAMYNYVSRKSSTVEGKRESNRRRSQSLKERGFNVEPWEVDAFGRFWDELRGNTEKRHIGSQRARDIWNPESEDAKKRMMEEISDDWDEWKDEYEDEMEEVASKWKEADKKMRSEAAKKGWETRRRKAAEKAKRSAAAKKGWETRRRKMAGQ